MRDLQGIVHELKSRGVALRATEQAADTGTAAGKAFLDTLDVFAEFETNLRREERLGPAAIARRLCIGRNSVYRAAGSLKLGTVQAAGLVRTL